MKLKNIIQRNHGWSRFELMVVTLISLLMICLILALLLPARMEQQRRRVHGVYAGARAQRINCVSNLKQISLALRIWEGDNNNKYPMAVSVTNGGAMELIDAGDVAGCLRVAAPELSTPKILICPADTSRIRAKSFSNGFDNSHVSYFLSLDATELYPQMIFSGDDNLTVDDVPVKPGIVGIPTNTVASLTAARHSHAGNVGLADGSVWEMSGADLRTALKVSVNGTPFATNRLAIP